MEHARQKGILETIKMYIQI